MDLFCIRLMEKYTFSIVFREVPTFFLTVLKIVHRFRTRVTVLMSQSSQGARLRLLGSMPVFLVPRRFISWVLNCSP